MWLHRPVQQEVFGFTLLLASFSFKILLLEFLVLLLYYNSGDYHSAVTLGWHFDGINATETHIHLYTGGLVLVQ